MKARATGTAATPSGASDDDRHAARAAALAPVQIAYHVPDPAAAAERLRARVRLGAVLPDGTHRARAQPASRHAGEVSITAPPTARLGEIMVELITQHDDTPSALRDMYAAHESGLHHVACFVPALQPALARLSRAWHRDRARCAHDDGRRLRDGRPHGHARAHAGALRAGPRPAALLCPRAQGRRRLGRLAPAAPARADAPRRHRGSTRWDDSTARWR